MLDSLFDPTRCWLRLEEILTLEDILETLIGHEIIDEDDKDVDMQKLAKRLWKAKTQKYGIELEKSKN